MFKSPLCLKNLLKPKKVYNLYYYLPPLGFSIDTRQLKPGDYFIALRGKRFNGADFVKEAVKKGARGVISEIDNPGIKIPFYWVKDALSALGIIAGYIRQRFNPFVYAIVGSLGKTTTKEMLSFLLEDNYSLIKNKGTENNLIGVSKTCFSLMKNNSLKRKVMVVELGTSEKGEIEKLARVILPDVAIITFIKPAHLSGLGNLEDIYQEKTSIFRVKKNITPVLNADDKYLRRLNLELNNIRWFGLKTKRGLYAKAVKYSFFKTDFLIQNKFSLSINSCFPDFIYNALGSLAAAECLGLPLEVLVKKLNNFKEYLPLRMEMKKKRGIFLVNDAYNSNPYSLQQGLKALNCYPGRKIAILGDMLELGKRSAYYHRQIGAFLMKSKFNYCLTIGKEIKFLKEYLKRKGYRYIFHFSEGKQLNKFLKKIIKKDDLIFLKASRGVGLEKIVKI